MNDVADAGPDVVPDVVEDVAQGPLEVVAGGSESCVVDLAVRVPHEGRFQFIAHGQPYRGVERALSGGRASSCDRRALKAPYVGRYGVADAQAHGDPHDVSDVLIGLN